YCKNISHGLICTTVDKPPKKIRLLKSVGFETLESWLALDDNNQEGWKHLVAKSKGKIIKPKPFKPRPHQVKAIQKSLNHFKKNARGKIIMPCGTGKSLAAFWIAKRMNAKKILIAVPSLALLQQTLKVWTREFLIHDIKPDWLCVCSDESVKEDQDDFVSYTYDLGIEVTTDKGQIKKFLKTKSKNIKVIFTTYQSGKVTAQGSKGFTYDLGIMDEAHKTVGHGKKPMAHLIHQKNIKVKNRLFMTATERLFRGDEEEYLSMDDPRDYGKIIYQLSFKEAINSKPPIISDYKVITFGISEPEIEEVYKTNKYIQVKKEIKDITAREFATAIALRKAIRKLKISNAVSFHRSIRRAENFRKQQELISKIYSGYQPIKTFHVSGAMPTNQRSSQMRLFAESKGLMTNARCLTEGVDLPAIDCVCFTDPKRSKVDIVQAAGRALRLSKGKKFGYILIPIFVSKNQDPNDAAEDSGFEEVISTVGALSTQDTRIADYLRGVAEGNIPRGGSPIDGITKVNILTKVDSDVFEKSIQLKVWNKIAKINYRSFDEARKFAKSLELKSSSEWNNFCRLKKKPLDIPQDVRYIYKNKGWTSMGDFLGTGRIADQLKEYLSYREAKKSIHKLKLQSVRDWAKYTKSINFPVNIPKHPHQTYSKNNTWVSYGDFLGTGRVSDNLKKYRSFKEARIFARSLKLSQRKEWDILFQKNKLPKDIPLAPHNTYKNQFVSYSDFFGITMKTAKRNFMSFKKAKKFVLKLNLKNQKDWMKYSKGGSKPDNLPGDPAGIYKGKGWKNLGDFLGTGRIATKKRNYRSYEKTKKYIRKFKFKSGNEFEKFASSIKCPSDIPIKVRGVYKNEGWVSMGDFLGTGYQRQKNCCSYNEAKKRIKKYKISSQTEYFKFCKQNKRIIEKENIPVMASQYYMRKNQWKNWGDFLGTGRIASQDLRLVYWNFTKVKKHVQKLKLKSNNEWRVYSKNKRPQFIPSNPEKIYKNKGWKGWKDFLGTG
ncbi:MAG: DEAD/DEAH box helicase family protein, partial [Pelagibacterales bacterium]|nr:DEAD/DEAH box helicase family protein [Pelagibacterales bacterium]